MSYILIILGHYYLVFLLPSAFTHHVTLLYSLFLCNQDLAIMLKIIYPLCYLVPTSEVVTHCATLMYVLVLTVCCMHT